MLSFKQRLFVSPEMSKYISEQTNKSIQKYSNNNFKRVFNLVKYKDVDSLISNFYFVLPFVSFISFLAGYNFHKLIHK